MKKFFDSIQTKLSKFHKTFNTNCAVGNWAQGVCSYWSDWWFNTEGVFKKAVKLAYDTFSYVVNRAWTLVNLCACFLLLA